MVVRIAGHHGTLFPMLQRLCAVLPKRCALRESISKSCQWQLNVLKSCLVLKNHVQMLLVCSSLTMLLGWPKNLMPPHTGSYLQSICSPGPHLVVLWVESVVAAVCQGRLDCPPCAQQTASCCGWVQVHDITVNRYLSMIWWYVNRYIISLWRIHNSCKWFANDLYICNLLREGSSWVEAKVPQAKWLLLAIGTNFRDTSVTQCATRAWTCHIMIIMSRIW